MGGDIATLKMPSTRFGAAGADRLYYTIGNFTR